MKHNLDLKLNPSGKPVRRILGGIVPRGEIIADQFETLWNHLYNDTRSIFRPDEGKHLHPRIDVLESKNIYDIRIDLPGVDANSIELQTSGKNLMVKAKRACQGSDEFKMSHCEHKAELYERGIRLADDAVVEEKTATFSDGILSVRVPRKAA